MRIRLIAVGGKMPDWVQTGYRDYARRLPRDCAVELVEVPLGPRGKGSPTRRAREREGEAMNAAIGPRDRVIALEVGGRAWSTGQLADQLGQWRMSGDDFSLLIGGPDGLAPQCLNRAERRWSLSALTLPHPLVRIVVIEQLYRAWTVLQGHPYHK